MTSTPAIRRFSTSLWPGVRISDSRYAPGLRQAAHDHAYASISLVVAGSLEERAASTTTMARSTHVVIKPVGVVHADEFGPSGARMIQLAWEPDKTRNAPQWGRMFSRYRWIDGGPESTAMMRLYRVFAGEEYCPALALEECLLDLTALVDTRVASGTGSRAPWLDRVVERLAAPAERPPRVCQLAAEAGVHPVYLARAFRRRHGTSISRYVRRVRVNEACRRLAASSESLSTIALALGFADQPHFCRAFRAEMGMTPAGFRRLLGQN